MIRLAVIVPLYLLNVIASQSIFVTFLTLPLFTIIAWNLMHLRTIYLTKYDMFWFCMFIFFVIGPCQAINDGMIGARPDSPVGGVTRYTYDNWEFVTAMAVVVVFSLGFWASSAFVNARRKDPPSTGAESVRIDVHVLLGTAAICFLLFVILSGGIDNVLASRLEKVDDDLAAGRSLPLAVLGICTVLLTAAYRAGPPDRPVLVLYILILLILLFVAQNPFNASRFALLAAWLPVALAAVRGRLKAATFYVTALVAIIFAFPVLSITTRVGIDGLDQLDISTLREGFFKLPFIDIFDTLVHAVRMTEASGWWYGDKTLAIVLFFVPRAIWEAKPIVGGLDVGYDLYFARMAGTPNLSFFIGGDFYMDFGFLGVLTGSAVCGYIFAYISGRRFGVFFGQNIYEYVLIASLPILIRGPVGAILMLFCCQCAGLTILHAGTRWWLAFRRQADYVRA